MTRSASPASPLPLAAAIFMTVPALVAPASPARAQAEAPVLPAVRVQGGADPAPADGYAASTTRVGRTLQSPHDIPQGVTTVTRSLLDDQDAATLREALRNVAGITFNAAEGGRSGDNANLRGFYTFGDMYLDGIRDTAQYDREVFAIEQVDVLRGAAAMLFGRGQAGGVINQQSKVPALVGGTNRVAATVGGDGRRQLTADLQRRVGEETAVRLNAMTRDEGSRRRAPDGSTPELHRDGLALAALTQLAPGQQLSFNHLVTRNRDRPDYGVPFDRRAGGTQRPAGDPRRFYGDARDFDDGTTTMTTLAHAWRLSPAAELTTRVRRSRWEREYWATAPGVNAAGEGVASTAYKTRRFDTENLALQSDLALRFATGPLRHRVLAGVEVLREDSTRWSLAFSPAEIAAFGYANRVVRNPFAYRGTTVAAYAQDAIEFAPGWSIVAGVRRDRLDADYSSTTDAAGASPASVTAWNLRYAQNSVRAALSWQPDAGTHHYLAWSDSFSPTADLYQLSSVAYPAERSDVVELGTKRLWFDGALAARAAIYRATKRWERNTDLESTAAILTRKRHTDGIELELAGRITPAWDVFAGLALMDATIDVPGLTGAGAPANAAYEGLRPRNTPPYAANLWTTYRLPGRWRAGGGVEIKGDRLAYGPNGAAAPVAAVAPAYRRWDASVSYEERAWALRATLRNLTNRVYYDAIYDSGGFAVPGARRTLLVTGELKF